MAKDLIRFYGSDSNLFGYSSLGPVNRIDPTGLSDCPGASEKGQKACCLQDYIDVLEVSSEDIGGDAEEIGVDELTEEVIDRIDDAKAAQDQNIFEDQCVLHDDGECRDGNVGQYR